MKRACQRHTTGLALPDRRMISDVPQAPDMLLRRVAIGHNRLKPTAIVRRDLDRNSRSHHESLNCFGRFGNRPIESDERTILHSTFSMKESMHGLTDA